MDVLGFRFQFSQPRLDTSAGEPREGETSAQLLLSLQFKGPLRLTCV
jgi:hypothetical protein